MKFYSLHHYNLLRESASQSNDKEVAKPRSFSSEVGREAVMLGAGGALEGAVLGGLALRKGAKMSKAMGKQVAKPAMRRTMSRLGKRVARDTAGASIFGMGLGAAQHGYDVKDYNEKISDKKLRTDKA